MPNTNTSPNMNLPVPVVGVDPGPAWANDVVACFSGVDSHNHSSGQGVPINPGGLNINADLPFNGQNATLLRSARFAPQMAPLANAADLGALYELGVDLYYIDGNGNQVRITQSGSVAGSAGTITGLPSGTASASFAGGVFTWRQSTNTPAGMAVGPLIIGASVANPKTVTLGASASQPADYNLTLPLAAPAANQVQVSDGAGNLSWTLGILPIGSIIATFPNLGGAYTTVATTAADTHGFVLCVGQTIADASSPMNGQVIPNINSSRFIRGNTVSGSTGGADTVTLGITNLASHNHGAGTYAVTSLSVAYTAPVLSGGAPSLTGTTTFANAGHTHVMSHAHQWGYGAGTQAQLYSLATSNPAVPTFNTNGTLAFDSTQTVEGVGFPSGGPYIATIEVAGNNSWFTGGALNAPNGTDGSGARTSTESSSSSVGITGGNFSLSTGAASLSGSNAVSGVSGQGGGGSPFDIVPTYTSAVYIMRIK